MARARAVCYLQRMFTQVLALLLTSLPAPAARTSRLLRPDLSASTKNAVCEAHLAVVRDDDTAAILAELREFNARHLQSDAESPAFAYLPPLHVGGTPTAADTAAVSAHLRGLDAWAMDGGRVVATRATGDAIEGYFAAREYELRAIEAALEPNDDEASSRGRVWARNALAVGLLSMPWLGAPALLFGVAVDPAANLIVNRRADRQGARADEIIKAFLAQTPEQRAGRWAYVARRYRVSRRTLDAVWSRDPHLLSRSLRDDVREGLWSLDRHVVAPARDILQGHPARASFGDRRAGVVLINQLIHQPSAGEPPVLRTVVRLVPGPR